MEATVQQFLKAIGQGVEGQFIEVRLIHVKRSEWYSSSEALAQDFDRLNGLKANLYYGVCPRFTKCGSKAGVRTVPCLWADLDAHDYDGGKEEAWAVLQAFPIPPTAIIDSGNGYHAYWTLTQPFNISNPQDLTQIEGYLKALGQALHADRSGAEVARILRLPDSVNYKDVSNPKPVTVVTLEASRRYALSEFDKFVVAIKPTDIKPKQTVADLVNGLGAGNHHTPLLSLAGKFAYQGLSYEDTLAAICKIAEAEGVSQNEAIGLVDYAYGKNSSKNSAVSCVPASPTRKGGTQDAQPQSIGVTAYSFHDCMTYAASPTPWMVDNILPETGAGILAGLGYIGKSFVLMDLGLEVARGGVWLSRYQASKRPVIYVDQENSRNEITRRLKKLAKGKGIEPDADLNMTVVTADRLPLDAPEGLEALRTLLVERRGALVIVDSLIRVFNGDENSSRDMAKLSQNVLRLCREFECFCLLADHLGKNPSHGHGANLRGTTEKFAFCDVVFECQRTDVGNLRLSNTKQRSGQTVAAFELRLSDPTEDSTILELLASDLEFQGAPLDSDGEARDFVVGYVTENGESTRPAIVDAAKARGITKNKVDTVLVGLCPDTLKYDHRLNGATGKWTNYYRRADSGRQEDLDFFGEEPTVN